MHSVRNEKAVLRLHKVQCGNSDIFIIEGGNSDIFDNLGGNSDMNRFVYFMIKCEYAAITSIRRLERI